MELRVARQIAALDEIHAFIADFCTRREITAATTFAIQLVSEELFTNLVKYNRGGGDTVLLGIERDSERVVIRLTDDDVDAFDPALAPLVDVAAPLSQRRAGGLGLHLVRAYVDKIDYEYRERTMRITAIKLLEAHDV